MRARRLLAAASTLLLAGCVSLPSTGGVETRPGQEQGEQRDATFDFTPSGPVPGSPPLEIVEDFMLAMQASPQSTAVARRYLTDEASATWSPDRSTLVYGAKLVSGARHTFEVGLEETVRLDDRGTWMGTVGAEGSLSYPLSLVRERGEWRIVNPPDALVIPRSHFDSRYQQFAVYFFDPTRQVLVPEPTYLPRGDQAPTLLVRRLLRGPQPHLEGVLDTVIPAGTENVLSVPVSPDGVAEVPLSGEMLQLDPERLEMALAQLAWTLRQVTGLESMRVTVDGSPLEVAGEVSPQSVTAWTAFDPAIFWASDELFALSDGHVVALSASGELVGRFGAQEYALRDIAVDLAGERVAAVSEDGTTVVLAPRGERADEVPPAQETEVLTDRGTDLLQPAWDVFGDLWLVDRTRDGARLSVRHDDSWARLDAPGLTGVDVSAFTVSRDGTRLVAVEERPSGDRLLMARVVRDAEGEVQALTRAEQLPFDQGAIDEIRDVAWSAPGSLAVLTAPTPATTSVLPVLVDGSSSLADADPSAETLRHRADRLVASPSAEAPLYVADPGGELFELGPDGEWVGVGLDGPLRAPTYVG